MWSNYQFIDPGQGDENFTHMVLVAPLDVFRVDPGDQVCWSALGFGVEPPPMFKYKTDLTRCRYKVVSQFTSALQEGKSLATAAAAGVVVTMAPIDTESTGVGAVPKDNSPSASKVTAKCKIKSSMKNCMAATDDSLGKQRANETEITTDVATITSGGDTPTTLPVNTPMLNQAQEMVCRLFNQTKILDKCRICVAQVVGTKCWTLSSIYILPFSHFQCSGSFACEDDDSASGDGQLWLQHLSWLCGWYTGENPGILWKAAWSQYSSEQPSDEHDSGMGSSTSLSVMQAHDTSSGSISAKTVPTNKENPFPDEIMSIMKYVMSSVGRYMHAKTKVVAKHLGGVEVMVYLGHIFNMRLNFQTLMWQLVMTDNIYLPTLTREHLRRETETLWLFAEILPIITQCLIPPLPFPIMAPAPSASQNTSELSIGGPSLPLTPVGSGTATGTGIITPATTLAMTSSWETQPVAPLSGWQKLLSRLGSKLLSYSSTPAIGAR